MKPRPYSKELEEKLDMLNHIGDGRILATKAELLALIKQEKIELLEFLLGRAQNTILPSTTVSNSEASPVFLGAVPEEYMKTVPAQTITAEIKRLKGDK